MNQKGFATVLGLCLIMAIALCVKGIQEAQMNQSYVTTDFQAEIDLQNVAESGIYAAVDKVRQELALNKDYLKAEDQIRRNHLFPVFSTTQETSSGNIAVEVWAERILIYPYKVNYAISVKSKYRADKIGDRKEVYTLLSLATFDSERTGKIFSRQAFDYVELDENGDIDNANNAIHFMDNTKNLDEYLFYKPNVDPTK